MSGNTQSRAQRGVRRAQTLGPGRVHRRDHRPGPARHRRRSAADRRTRAGERLIVEPALVERLLADTAESADALPLLALTLERLYRDFGGDGNLTAEEYEHEAIGGIAQVVQTEVDTLLGADPEQRQARLELLHDAFIPWLATINPGNDQPMRRLARWDDLPAARTLPRIVGAGPTRLASF